MSDAADKKPKRHKVLTVVLGIVAVCIFIGMFGAAHKDAAQPTVAGTTKSSTGQSTTIAGLNQAVRDGKFEFTVKSLDCGHASVGSNPYLTKTAQGQYCLVDVSVKNIGNESQTLFASNQYLLNGSQKYSADDTATMYAAPDSSSTWYSDINPGNSVEGVIVFDVPKGVTPTMAELHDSSLSGGVRVKLQ